MNTIAIDVKNVKIYSFRRNHKIMWVRNQNKILLVDSHIFNVIKNDDQFVILSQIGEKIMPIAYYKTKEKAMMILDAIQKQIINRYDFYQMPIEEEVKK